MKEEAKQLLLRMPEACAGILKICKWGRRQMKVVQCQLPENNKPQRRGVGVLCEVEEHTTAATAQKAGVVQSVYGRKARTNMITVALQSFENPISPSLHIFG